MKRLIAVAGLVSLVCCQAPPAEMTEAEIAQIEAEVLAQANALIETQNALDTDGFMAHFSTEHLEWFNQDAHYTSYQDVLAVAEDFFNGLDAFDSGWKTVSVKALSEKFALCRGEWWGVQTSGESVTRQESMLWTALHELQEDGSWKITTVHQSWADLVTEG